MKNIWRIIMEKSGGNRIISIETLKIAKEITDEDEFRHLTEETIRKEFEEDQRERKRPIKAGDRVGTADGEATVIAVEDDGRTLKIKFDDGEEVTTSKDDIFLLEKPVKEEKAITLEELKEKPSLADYVIKRPEIHSKEVIDEAERIKKEAERPPLELKPTEPTPEEKIAIAKQKGEIKAPPKGKKRRAVIPTEKIKVPTTGKQRDIFGRKKKGQVDLEDLIEEKKKAEAKEEKPKKPKAVEKVVPGVKTKEVKRAKEEKPKPEGKAPEAIPGPAPGRRAAPTPTGREVTGGRKQKRVRPGLRVASETLLPKPPDKISAGQYGILAKDQRFAVNLALHSFLDNKKKGFMLADGTGVGKTLIELTVAREMADQTGKPSLIITQNEQIIRGNFKADAKKAGIDLDNIEIGTYHGLRAGKVGKKDYGVVIFDEAHNLKNVQAGKTIAAESVNADHRLYATATPMDRPTGASYFLSQITGIPQEDIQRRLGFEVKEMYDSKTNQVRKWTVLLEGHSWADVMDNIVDMRDQAIRDGAMIRREFPFFGDVKQERRSMPYDLQLEQKDIDRYWQAKISSARNPNTKRNYAGQRILELSRWAESKKVDWIYDMAMKDIENGYHVVIVAEGINDTMIKGLGEEVPGFIGAFENKLNAEGKIKDWARIFGSGNKALQVKKFQEGTVKLALMTPQSGGTGINLDDTLGDKPRRVYIVTPNFSGDVFQQILGRFSRRFTASPAEIVFTFYDNALSDERRMEIATRKQRTLRAIQEGADLDKAHGFEETGEMEEPGPMIFGEEVGERAPPNQVNFNQALTK
jgi:hypothetical protein